MATLLVPTDGSEASLSALRHAIGLARHLPGSTLHLLNVQPPLPSSVTSFLAGSQVSSYHADEGEKALQPAKAILAEAGLPFESHIETGQAPSCIAEVATRVHADQIVMGTRGLGGVASAVLGSVAQRVIGQVTIPVTLVH